MINNLSDRTPTKRLKQWLRFNKAQLAKKQAVMAKHEVGTPYHTRAMREASAYQENIEQITEELERR